MDNPSLSTFYLKNAELTIEATKGNYNMIDGLINNEPPEKPDLTDGQTHDELKGLTPETLPESKPSIGERIKALQADARETITEQPAGNDELDR